jgi:hypothetical protein
MSVSHRPRPDKHALSAREELWVDYEGTPYLTGLAQICAFLGVFIGALAVVVLIGNLKYGFGRYWWLILVLAVDVAANGAVQLARARRRRTLGLSRAQRLFRMGLGPPPPRREDETGPSH